METSEDGGIVFTRAVVGEKMCGRVLHQGEDECSAKARWTVFPDYSCTLHLELPFPVL